MYRFSAIFKPTALFSLKDSNSTSSGAKSLVLPSPYSIKMAFISNAISKGGVCFDTEDSLFNIVRNAKISYYINGDCCINNCLIKIQKGEKYFTPTVSFREYVYMNGSIEVIFDMETESDVTFLKQYLHSINYFGKRGCFWQFIGYNDNPNEANVVEFNPSNPYFHGIIQEYDDFDSHCTFSQINNYSTEKTKRAKRLLVLPYTITSASKSYTRYSLNN